MISNMGTANPRAAAERTLGVTRELGLEGLKVACSEGDDVSALVPRDQPFMDEPNSLADVDLPLVGMNAYLGADAIRPALEAGADVIIGGRHAYPSMFLAAVAHHFGWAAMDMARMGAGTLVGHLMECGMQMTGGYFADLVVKDANLARSPRCKLTAALSSLNSAKAGDKGNTSNINTWVHDLADFELLKRTLMAERIKQAFPHVIRGV